MIKRGLLGLLLLGTMTSSFREPIRAEAINSNEYSDKIQNYLNIEEDQTIRGWIQKDSWSGRDSATYYELDTNPDVNILISNKAERSPIIFFDLNNNTGIQEITAVYFKITDNKTGKTATFVDYEGYYHNCLKEVDKGVSEKDALRNVEFEERIESKVSVDDRHIMRFREQVVYHFRGYTQTYQYYDYVQVGNSGNFSFLGEKKVSRGGGTDGHYVYEIAIPRLGRVNSVLQNFYDTFSQVNHGDSIRDSFIYNYLTTPVNKGFKTLNSLKTDLLSGANYSHYLILPITETSEYVIDYLAVEGIDKDGNVISPHIEVTESNDSQGLNYFEIGKEDSNWTSTNAVFFPGNNLYMVDYAELVSLKLKDGYELKSMPFIAMGQLRNSTQQSIDISQILRREAFIEVNKELSLKYTFDGKADTLIVVIPDQFAEAKVRVHFKKIDDSVIDDTGIFGINLVDENGNLGIRGGLPLEDDPNKKKSWFSRFMDRVNSFFGVSNPIDGFKKLLETIVLVIAIILLVYVVLKIIPMFKLITKGNSKSKGKK